MPVTINDWLKFATSELKSAEIESYHLDAELILAFLIKKNRVFLHTHPEQIISSGICQLANKRLKDRKKHIPLAYIVQHKEFYGRDFFVNKSTLVPRPESEDIINLLLDNIKPHHKTLSDIGTGSGCLGITAKLEIPRLSVTLCDVSSAALGIAKKNSRAMNAEVSILKSNLLSKLANKQDIILANLPYVDKSWYRSPETYYEPKQALIAKDNGLALINRLVLQASKKINSQGLLIIEGDIRQHQQILDLAKKNGFNYIKTQGYILLFEKS